MARLGRRVYLAQESGELVDDMLACRLLGWRNARHNRG